VNNSGYDKIKQNKLSSFNGIIGKGSLNMNGIILFDGECNFCEKSVQFIIKRDPNGYFKFASLQSEIGKKLRKKYNVPEHIDSLLLIEQDKWYDKSSAALRICKNLKGFYKISFVFLIIPKPIRDFFYDILAKNRYKWFGKTNHCVIPSQKIRNRFL